MRRLAFHEAMGVLGVGDLHPGGPAATEFLLAQVAEERPRLVLEIGAGIGLTTERMVGRGWDVVPLEPNPVLRRELEARLPLRAHAGDLASFRGDEAPFDAVIGESVFYDMDLAAAFGKVHRLLRPGGVLAFVEMVWTEVASPEVAARVHDETRETFGLPMASRERLTRSDWKACLSAAGFAEVAERAFRGAPGRSKDGDRSIAMGAALRHPFAFAQHLRYRSLTRTPRVPLDWLESYVAVWRHHPPALV